MGGLQSLWSALAHGLLFGAAACGGVLPRGSARLRLVLRPSVQARHTTAQAAALQLTSAAYQPAFRCAIPVVSHATTTPYL